MAAQNRPERRAKSCDALISGIRAPGYGNAPNCALQALIITLFNGSVENGFDFEAFQDTLEKQVFAIYAGKITARNTFRIAVIGAKDRTVIEA